MTIQGERIREVIVKGEEYFDGRKINYVQTPTKEEPFWVIALTNGALIVTTVPTYVAVKAPEEKSQQS